MTLFERLRSEGWIEFEPTFSESGRLVSRLSQKQVYDWDMSLGKIPCLQLEANVVASAHPVPKLDWQLSLLTEHEQGFWVTFCALAVSTEWLEANFDAEVDAMIRCWKAASKSIAEEMAL